MAILKVQADAVNVLVESDGVIAIHSVDNRGPHDGCHVVAATISVIAGRIRQIDKQIFCFECPMLGHGNFNSAAHRPAEYRTTLIRQAGQGRFYIGAGAAGGSVDQNAVPRIAEARTERSQPIARGLAAQSGGGRSRSGGKKNAGALLLLPLIPCQSKSPSTPNTHAPHWPLTPIVAPTRPPLTLKFPVELRPDGLRGSLPHSLCPTA